MGQRARIRCPAGEWIIVPDLRICIPDRQDRRRVIGGQRYGQPAPGARVSGLEEEFELSGGLPRLLYVKTPAPDRDSGLAGGYFRMLTARLRLQLAKVYLALADLATAHQLVREIDDILKHRPALGTLAGEVEEFRRILASSATARATGRLPLTQAELRLLPYLQTHLNASGIAERLFVSQHIVKSQMMSIYRKLGVSSRNEAVQAATAIDLLG